MIGKIRRIRSFGSFVDFDWPAELCEFKRFNVFYGWNYSGKTMLSRVFRCFENKVLHPDFPSAEGQLVCVDNSTYSLGGPAGLLEIRVFNSDFVRENLKFDEGSAAPILVLGAEDIAKKSDLEEKNRRHKEIRQSKEDAEKKLKQTEMFLEKALSAKARDAIKNPLGVPNYDKTRFEPKVLACMDAPEKDLLDDESVSRYSSQFLSKEKKDALNEVVLTIGSLDTLKARASQALSKCVASQRIQRLVNNPVAERWVDSGRPLHEKIETCLFCGQPLPPGLLDTLKQHFSEEYDLLMGELSKLSSDIAEARNEQINLPHAAEFYPEQAALFATEGREVKRLEEERQFALKKLADAVDAKRLKAFTDLECPEVIDPKEKIKEHLKKINELISQHNERTAEFERIRQAALYKLEMHAAATFVIEQNYATSQIENEEIQSQIEKADGELTTLNAEILALETQLSEATAGAERINELLKAYFGKDDIKIQVSGDKQFQISRDGAIAKNLSEGEKTAIAFAYYITRVQDGKNALADIIVVIDDPISSLDANHLFNTYALIKIQVGGCKQLFLMTHSFELFNLVKEWAKEDSKPKQMEKFPEWSDWRFFIIRRTDDRKSKIENVRKELMRFHSEYHYLFGELYRFASDDSDNLDTLFTLPNVTRRFMEAFGGIMIPKPQGLKQKMPQFFSDPIERERVWKFINDYSHQTTLMRSLTIPDLSECKSVVNSCLNAVRAWDEQYFQDLMSEIS
jgi:wobble nucleotide-excising tRNase